MKGSMGSAEVAITKGYGKGVNAWIIRAKEISYEIGPNGLITLRITEEKDVVKVKEGQRGGIPEEEKDKKEECSAKESVNDDDARGVDDGDKTGKHRKRKNKCSIEGCTNFSKGRLSIDDSFGPPGLRCKRHGGGTRCSILGCNTSSHGRVPNVDRFGPPGYRCCRHGGGTRCSIEGCRAPSQGRVPNVDRFGTPGYRCCRHGGGRRCSVKECTSFARNRFSNADPFGPPGLRCFRHGGK